MKTGASGRRSRMLQVNPDFVVRYEVFVEGCDIVLEARLETEVVLFLAAVA